MAVSRRKFLGLTIKGIFIAGAGSLWEPASAMDFLLPSKNKVALRFAIASDGHYGQDKTDYDFHHDNMLKWLNAEKKSRGLDFSVINGDLFHNDPKFLPLVRSKWDQLTMPYYVSRGNHDRVNDQEWNRVWNIPVHHDFEKNGTCFLILNTANEQGDYICPDLEWTRQKLNEYADRKHLFIFMHITPFKWTKGGIDCADLTALFAKQKNLRAIFHGHDHDQDGVKTSDEKSYFFDSHIAGDWGTEYRGYRVVEVMKDGKILLYQMDALHSNKINSNSILS